MKIYIASSCRNDHQPAIIRDLEAAGHEVYDFRHGVKFKWSDIDPNWITWSSQTFREALGHPFAHDAFEADLCGMKWAEAFVLVAPAGRSAHLELGWATGAGKPAYILLSDGEPELMYKLATGLCTSIGAVLSSLKVWEDNYAEDSRAREKGAARTSVPPSWPEHEGWGRPYISTETHYFRAGSRDSICEWWFNYDGMRYAPHKILDDGTECQTCIRILRKAGVK